MAWVDGKSGTFIIYTNNTAISGYVQWNEKYDVVANESEVTLTAYLHRTNIYDGRTWIDTGTVTKSAYFGTEAVTTTTTGTSSAMSIAGSSSNGTPTSGGGPFTQVYSASKKIPHNTDGSKSITLGYEMSNNVTGVAGRSFTVEKTTTTVELTVIPRASNITASSNTVTMGNSITLTITPADNTFKHKLRYEFGTLVSQITGFKLNDAEITPDFFSNGTITFTPPVSLGSESPNAISGTCKILLYTYRSDGSHIGTKTIDVTVSVPSYSLTIDSFKITGNNLLSGAYVQGKSTVTAETTATTLYGASIKSYSYAIDGKTYTGQKVTSSALSHGNKKVVVTVTDTRGKTLSSTSSEFTVYAYAEPTLTEFTLARNETVASTVVATVKGTVSAVNNKNAKTVIVTIDGQTKTVTASSYTVNTQITFTNVDTDNTLTITAEIKDSYTSAKKEAVLPTEAVTMDFHNSGKGIAFGKVAETEGLLDVAWDTNIKRNLNVDGVLTLGGVELNGNDLLNLSNTDSYGGKNTFIYNSQTVANSYGNTLSGASINLAANSTYLVLVGVIASDGAQTTYSDILLAGVETGGELLINCPGRGGAYAGGGVCGFAIVKTTSATFARCQSHGYKNASFNLYMRIVAIKLDT